MFHVSSRFFRWFLLCLIGGICGVAAVVASWYFARYNTSQFQILRQVDTTFTLPYDIRPVAHDFDTFRWKKMHRDVFVTYHSTWILYRHTQIVRSRMLGDIDISLQRLRRVFEEVQNTGFSQLASLSGALIRGREFPLQTASLSELHDFSHWSQQQAVIFDELAEVFLRDIVVTDVADLQDQMTFLASVFRYTGASQGPLLLEKQKEFQQIFSPGNMYAFSREDLTLRYHHFRASLSQLITEADIIRQQARIKRADLVVQELKKWTDDTLLPEPQIPNMFDQVNVSLADQMMYLFEDGELILSTPITSGRQNFETVTGQFAIRNKQRNKLMKSPFPDEDYELWVDYWLGFHGAYGFHDSCNDRDCWRTRFGGKNYMANGSHGCVNTPYNSVKFLYNWAKVGTGVHVQ